jgi:hypothetical protein
MDNLKIDVTAERLERLERECDGLKRQARQLKRAGAILALGAAALMMAGAQRDDAPMEIDVQRLVIRGDDGKVYAELGIRARGDGVRFPFFQFHDEQGKTRFYAGQSELKFFDKDQRNRFGIDESADGAMSLGFHDKTGSTELSVGTFIDGAAGVHLFGPDGKGKRGRDHGGLFVNPDGSTLLHLFRPGSLAGNDTHERVALGVDSDGRTSLVLRGEDFKAAIRATIPPAAKSTLTIEGVPIP